MNGAGMRYKGSKYYKAQGKESAYDALLSIIDSLQQEQPPLPSNLDKAAEEWCKTNNKGIALSADKKSHYLAEGEDAFKAGVNYALSQINLPVWRKRNKILGWYLNPINMTLCHDGYEISLEELKNLVHEN